MINEGRIQPRVHTSAPNVPYTLCPTNVAELIEIGPGVISAMVNK